MQLSRVQIRLLKDALRSLPVARERSNGDDINNLAISLDLETFLDQRGPGYLTDYQYLVINQTLFEGYSEIELARNLGISQQAVSYAMTAGLRKIYHHIRDPRNKPDGPIFDEDSRQALIDLYHSGASAKDIAIALDLRLNTVRNKIRQLREKGVLVGDSRKIRASKSE